MHEINEEEPIPAGRPAPEIEPEVTPERKNNSPIFCGQLLDEYRARTEGKHFRSELFEFEKGKGNVRKLAGFFKTATDDETDSALAEVTIYNPTKEHHQLVFVRIEKRSSEDSYVAVFTLDENGHTLHLREEMPRFHMQDPFLALDVEGYIIIGGTEKYLPKVEISQDPSGEGQESYRTVFYRYHEDLRKELLDSEGNLKEPFARGPDRMKDIRLTQLPSGKIAVFTRPQGEIGGRGKIGYIEIESLDNLEESIPKAKIIEDLFTDEEWGGANELHVLPNGIIGILGHIARQVPLDPPRDGFTVAKEYFPITFCFDPSDEKVFGLKIIATHESFDLPVKPKRADLAHVVFPGGLIRGQDSTTLFAGIGDAVAGKIEIPGDPLKECEDFCR